MIVDHCSRFTLRLSDGAHWVFNAANGASDWLRQFSRILELPAGCKGNGNAWTIDFDAADCPDDHCPWGVANQNGWKLCRQSGIHHIWRHAEGRRSTMVMTRRFMDHPEIQFINMWWALREVYQQVLAAGGTPIHAALVQIDGRGVLIAAAGGTGKSTCCRRLPAPWRVLSDDQALIVKTTDGRYQAHPLPTWSDYLWRASSHTWPVAQSVPLSAIFFLEQADCDAAAPYRSPADSIRKTLDAARQVWQPVWERLGRDEKRAQSRRLFNTTTAISTCIPTFRLQATLDGRFWRPMAQKIF